MAASRLDKLFRAAAGPRFEALQSAIQDLSSTTLSQLAASSGALDHMYARIGALNGPFFPRGWGNLSVVNYDEDLRHLVAGPPAAIRLAWRLVERGSRDGVDYMLYEGSFRTPCLQRVYDALPPESRTGRNICTLVLESPFYGSRRPAAQRGSKLLRVSDLLTLGWATIAESINLLHWLREEGAAVAYCDGAMRALRAGDRRLDQPDTVLRLKRVLETYTDVTRYPKPRRTDAAVIVAARDDAYVSRESVQQLHQYWAGSELRMDQIQVHTQTDMAQDTGTL
eukprot:XP_001701637.1 predicted protein [Chlamydomonas reinhardtii]